MRVTRVASGRSSRATWTDNRARRATNAAAAIAAKLREKEIFVRHFNAPRVNQHLRISIGTDAECDTLVDALKGIVA